MRCAWLAIALVAACVDSSSVPCGDRVCPRDSKCDEASGLCIPAGCGNGTVDTTEQCDGALVPSGNMCTDYGYYELAPVTCNAVCQLDRSACTQTCGDRIVNGPETCDGIPPPGRTCSDLGFDLGRLSCSPACSPGLEACTYMGWRSDPGGATNELRAISGPIGVGLGGAIVRGANGVWTPMTSPTAANLYGVWTTTGASYAVGAGGTILHFDGSTWVAMTSPTTNSLNGVAGTSPSNVYAVGDGGVILHFDGAGWSMLASPTTKNLAGVWVEGQTGYAVGEAGTVVALQGGSWTVIAGPSASVPLNAVFGGAGHVYIAGALGYFAHFDGATWSVIPVPLQVAPLPGLLSIWGSGITNVFVGGVGGTLLHYNNVQLSEEESNTTRSIYGLWGSTATHVWGATRGGDIIEYNGTDRVTKAPLAASDMLNAVFSSSVGFAATAVGSRAQIVEYNTQPTLDPVAVWNPPVTIAAAAAMTQLTALWRFGNLVIVGGQGGGGDGLYYSTTGVGATAFTKSTALGATLGIFGVTPPNASGLHIYAVGGYMNAGTIYESTNGTAWTQVVTPMTLEILDAVWGTPNGADWVTVGNNGAIYHGSGSTWTPMMSGVTERLLSVWGTSAQDVFAVGRVGTIVHYDGTSWRRMYTGVAENLTAITGTSHDDVFVAGSNGTLLHYDGIAWSRMSPASFGDVLGMFTSSHRSYFVGQTGGAELLTRTCTVNEDRCDNPWDDDCDGKTNCDDSDCKGTLACLRGGACPTIELLACGETTGNTYSGIARIDDLPCIPRSTPGPEASYRFVPERSGPLTVTLAADDDMDVVITRAINGACDLRTCKGAMTSGGTKSVTMDVTAGELYFVVVDGPLYTAKEFTLTVACP